jgi:uncharacterized protein YuzE
MDEQQDIKKYISVDYDKDGDILTYSFTKSPQIAIAEEAADDIWVRFVPETNNIITIDVLNFSSRLKTAFGPSMKYTERTDPELIHQSLLLKKTENDT